MTKWININKHVIGKNAKHGTNEPPIRVAEGKYGKPEYAHGLQILDKDGNVVLEMQYDPHGKILPCGARLAISTDAKVVLIGGKEDDTP